MVASVSPRTPKRMKEDKEAELTVAIAPIKWALSHIGEKTFSQAMSTMMSVQIRTEQGLVWRKKPTAPGALFTLTGARVGARNAIITGKVEPREPDMIVHEIDLLHAHNNLVGFTAWLEEMRGKMADQMIAAAEDQATKYTDNNQFGSW